VSRTLAAVSRLLTADDLQWTPFHPPSLELRDRSVLSAGATFAYCGELQAELKAVRAALHEAVALLNRQDIALTAAARQQEHLREELRRYTRLHTVPG
jgi:hypothetical protein